MSLTKVLTLSVILFSFLGTTCFAKKNNKAQEFKQELAQLKYDLYKYLNESNTEDLMRFELPTTDSVSILINEFCSKYESAIKDYQGEIMESYEKEFIFSEQDYKIEDIEFTGFSEYRDQFDSGLINLILMDPLSYANSLITVFEAQKNSAQEIALDTVKDRIANPKIFTKHIDKQNWQLTIDKYYKVYVLSYNICSNEMNLIKMLNRK